jgi:membrane-bound lytic murein transglycosylase B
LGKHSRPRPVVGRHGRPRPHIGTGIGVIPGIHARRRRSLHPAVAIGGLALTIAVEANAIAAALTPASVRLAARATSEPPPPYVAEPFIEPLAASLAGPPRRPIGSSMTASVGWTLPPNLTVSAKTIPKRALQAYVAAEAALRRTAPNCQLTWSLLAGIGFIESGHARGGGSGNPNWNGEAVPPIYGPRLDGTNGALFLDTDGGRIDGDPEFDRAVGPMQFIPQTWAVWAADGNKDGKADPQNIDDAALAAADYLCAASWRLSTPANLITAIYAYNHSYDYVRAVMTVDAEYAGVTPAALGIAQVPADAPTQSTVQQAVVAAAAPGVPVPVPQYPAAPVPPGTPFPPVTSEPTPSEPPTETPAPTQEPTPPPTDSPAPTPTDPPATDPSPADSPAPSPS